MSMNLTVYVGPYLRVVNCPDDLVYKYESVVCDGRGELYTEDPDDVTYVVPNCDLPGVTRQLQFSRDDDMPVIDIDDMDREKEMDAFRSVAWAFIDEAEAAGASVETRWGVVCCSS